MIGWRELASLSCHKSGFGLVTGREAGDDDGEQNEKILHILIRNIDRSLSQPEIVCHFRKYGRVKSCEVVKDEATGKSKGFGFAEMPNADEALRAIEELNGLKLGDSVLRVKRAAASTLAKKEPVVEEKRERGRGGVWKKKPGGEERGRERR